MRCKTIGGFGLIAVGSLLLLHVFQVLAVNLPDLTHLPIGDGKVSTTAPQIGYVFACQTMSGGGAQADGPWIHSDGTFDFTAKATVDGAVEWPEHALKITLDGQARNITTNDLPDHPTGTYPIASTDNAYQYDRNPNSISAQIYIADLPAMPVASNQPTCLSGGAIGVTLSGSVIFNALDAENRDALAHETQDSCQGHPERSGAYHYHSLSTCIPDTESGQSALMGYALDGFGIYGSRAADGTILTNADLDECHGTTSEIEWDGQQVVMYHYVATYEYPYTLGCYRGTPISLSGQGQQPGQGQQNQPPQNQNGQSQPPNGQQGQGGRSNLAAAAAKLGITEQALRDALSAPPPNLKAAAAKLGITAQALADALGLPPPR